MCNLKYLSLCLNPYYTGIHLHVINLLTRKTEFIVLILIILEYIYITTFRKKLKSFSVLILIILEYIYIIVCLYVAITANVLILIILEYIYMLLKSIENRIA